MRAKLDFFLSRGDSDAELIGVAPIVDASSGVKGRAANKLGRRQVSGRAYWPRIQGQFVKKTGLSRNPRDAFPLFLSFYSRAQVVAAGYENFKYDHFGLGVCVGVSPQLIWRMTIDTDRYYRSYELPKKSGGVRLIESPRVFLKVIQSFLADGVLNELLTHSSVHSFSRGRSILTNASMHAGKGFVGSVDIKDFFGSVNRKAIFDLLTRHGFREVEADVISKLCTKQDRLPQGAPTSPVLSNAILYEFDDAIYRHCQKSNMDYSRYADDITISGSSRSCVDEALLLVKNMLRVTYGLNLNDSKTRVASRGGRQRVTGIVVNKTPSPPREFCRNVRAAFNNAKKSKIDSTRLLELRGYLGYLRMFPKYENSKIVKAYEASIAQMNNS